VKAYWEKEEQNKGTRGKVNKERKSQRTETKPMNVNRNNTVDDLTHKSVSREMKRGEEWR
jgi:hypothetical protein